MPRCVLIFDCVSSIRQGVVLIVAALMTAGAVSVQAADGMSAMDMKAQRPEPGTSAAFSPAGTLYAVGKKGEHVLLHRSDDEGATWQLPVVVNVRPEAVAADGEGRPKIAFASDGAILVSWTHPLGKPYSGEVRLARTEDGKNFSAPITVHRDRAEITHRFDSLLAAPDGRVLVAWIDKRDMEAAKEAKTAYRGAAIYAAISRDGGRSFEPERKVADHSCECCRIASALDWDGVPLLMWRHVFSPNERDHAVSRIQPDGSPAGLQRATFDHWKIDGCPHHGPSLAVDTDGVRHAVWFNQKDGEGQVFYGQIPGSGSEGHVYGQRRVGGASAAHADLAVSGRRVAIVWKEFDGQQTLLRAEISDDAGNSFRSLELAVATGASDQPRALVRGDALYGFWRSEREGMRLFRLQ